MVKSLLKPHCFLFLSSSKKHTSKHELRRRLTLIQKRKLYRSTAWQLCVKHATLLLKGTNNYGFKLINPSNCALMSLTVCDQTSQCVIFHMKSDTLRPTPVKIYRVKTECVSSAYSRANDQPITRLIIASRRPVRLKSAGQCRSIGCVNSSNTHMHTVERRRWWSNAIKCLCESLRGPPVRRWGNGG